MPHPKPYAARAQHLDPQLYQEANLITFITICAVPLQTPFVRASLNQLMLEILISEQTRQSCSVFTYCLMPNHLHFLVKPNADGHSVLDFANQYKGKTTNAGWSSGWRGQLWQRKFYDHVVRSDESLIAIARYILDNPVRKGMVATADEWRWSGQMNDLPG